MKNNFPVLLQSFFQERLIEQKRVSHHTISSYRDALRLLLGFVTDQSGISPAKLTLNEFTVDRILAFLNHLENDRGCSIRSRNQRLAAIKAFFHHIAFKEPSALHSIQQVLEIPYKRFTRPMFGYLSKDEVNALLDAPDRSTRFGQRDYMLLAFMYNTGARISEVIQLQLEHLYLTSPYQVRIRGKGNKERVVPLWRKTAMSLANWLSVRKSFSPSSNHVFFNARGTPLSRGGGRHILGKAVVIASVKCISLTKKNVSPHTLRHTTAMHLLQSGVDVNVIRMWLGHVGLETTHQYIEADLDMKRRALEKGGIISTSQENALWQPSDEVMTFLDSL